MVRVSCLCAHIALILQHNKHTHTLFLSGVSTFVAEFLKRKDAEVARATAPAKRAGKAKKAAGPPPPTPAASVLQGKAQPSAPSASASAAGECGCSFAP